MREHSDIIQEGEDPPDGTVFDTIEKVDYWKSVKKASQHTELADKRFSEDEYKHYRYEFQPLPVMLSLGTLGVLLIGGQMFVPRGVWVESNGDFTGLIRMAMFFAGAICIFLAWPRHRDLRDSPEEEAETEALRERIARRKYRW